MKLLREKFLAWLLTVDPTRLVFIDETGSNIAMTRTYGRAKRGERLNERVPRNRGTVITIIGALTVAGFMAPMTIEGGTTKEVFLAWVREVLIPGLQPGDYVVMDNLGAHRVKEVKTLLEAAGACAVYLPPYSPDLNPIELCWSKLKEYLRSVKARTREELDRAVGDVLQLVTDEDAIGWFKHSGFDWALAI